MKNINKILVFIMIILLLILNTNCTRSDDRIESTPASSTEALEIISGLWRGANSSLGNVYYTAYLDMKIQNGILETVDWQAGNPGYKAKITGVDDKYIYIKILESDDFPADWKLKTKDKIQYEYDSNYELRLEYNGTTCIFYRQNELSDEMIKKMESFVNINWINQENRNFSASFSYFDIELYDTSKNSDNKIVFSGRTYFNTESSIIEVVPDITVVNASNPLWTGIEQEKTAELQYQLSEDGQILMLIYKGKETTFEKSY